MDQQVVSIFPKYGRWVVLAAVQRVHEMTRGHEGDLAYAPRVGAACDQVAADTGLDSDELYDQVMGG